MSHTPPRAHTLAQSVLVAWLASTFWAFSAAPLPTLPKPEHNATGVWSGQLLTWGMDSFDLMVNGGFEQGNLTGWESERFGGFNGQFVVDNGTVDPTGNEGVLPPLSGLYSVVTSAFNFGSPVLELRQTVSIPSGAESAILYWQDYIANYANNGEYQNGNPLHGVRVEVRAAGTTEIIFSTQPGFPAFNNWTKRQSNLTRFRGNTVTIAFIIGISAGNINLRLDNVSLRVAAPNLVTSDVYLGTNPSPGAADFRGNTAQLTWNPGPLAPNTTYYWRIVSRLNAELAASPTWQFTTAPIGPLHHFQWSPISSPQSPDAPIQVTLTAKDAADNTVTSFAGLASVSALALPSATAQTLLAPEPFTASSDFDRSTVGYSFTPSTDLWVTGVRAYSGRKVSLWTDAGVLLASQNVPANPQLWTVVPLPTPVPLLAGKRYRVGTYANSVVTHYARFDSLPTFPHGTIHQSYETQGDGFPNSPHPAQWWFVDLVYEARPPQALGITPPFTANFVNGVWTGSVEISPGAPQVALKARHSSGAAGISSLFAADSTGPSDGDADGDGMADDWEVANGLNPNNAADAALDSDDDGHSNLEEFRAGTHPRDAASALRVAAIRQSGAQVQIDFVAVAGKSYSVLSRSAAGSGVWTKVADVAEQPDDGLVTVTDANPIDASRFYRVVTPQQP